MNWLRRHPLAKPLIGVLIVAGVVLIVILQQRRAAQENEAERALIAQASLLTKDCKGPSARPRILSERKLLVWDTTKAQRSSAHDELSGGAQGSASDSLLAIVLVLPERREQVGTYSVSGSPAYRVYADICVINWPERQVVGRASAISAEPPSSRMVRHAPEYADPTQRLVELIESLRGPRGALAP